MSRRAFTLIELLVVIAIIAILAAILFPVFAQARESARKSACLSNTKQINLAMQQYINDYDETTPSIFGGGAAYLAFGYFPDFYITMQPYVKNMAVFFCPDRHEWKNDDDDTCADGYNTTSQCVGYGYNWGVAPNAGMGIVGPRVSVPIATGNLLVEPGKPLAALTAPAELYAFGDTGDVSRYSICPTYMFQYNDPNYTGATGAGLPGYTMTTGQTWAKWTNNKSIRHGGRLNMTFADGHSKSVAFKAGFLTPRGNAFTGFPKLRSDQLMYCSESSVVGTKWGLTMSCAEWCTWMEQNTVWYTD